ncbi:hypothetical protein [Azospirillum sp. ST 5-10]|uniref:hypothetical protein n=1 Tax=unclassified Azospirillum TaxID=2630922 RepID=UPI003F4A3662
MWQTFTTALVMALSFSAVAFGIAKAVVVVGTRRIERRHGLVGIRDTLARRARLEQRLEARRGERTAALKAIDARTQDVLLRRQQLDRRLAEATRGGDPVFRLIGEEMVGHSRFHAEVINRYVGVGASSSVPVDPSWAQPQAVEVWAPGLQEARREVERRYPPSFGYKVVRLHEVGVALKAAS